MLFHLSISLLFTACLVLVVSFILSMVANRKGGEWSSIDDLGVHLIIISAVLALAGIITFLVGVIV